MTLDLKRILQVEDDPDIATLSRLVLEEIGGYEIEQCVTLPEAVGLALNFQPQLLLLDYMLPGHSGLVIWNAIKMLPGYKDVPAIFLTARAEPELRAKLLGLGALAVLVKPFDAMKLSSIIGNRWRTKAGQI
ncbi:response regulator [Seohaeicola zhoushanensis]|uniref:Response regulator n=1 Tax=Seohaeicola zhoushanensis TaxID=1569283 RepID=A0A8J3H159_9RHOB|nr:response regulator [Seohaeicola zhoushanensis]GHF70799.1 response regulator [Seohaeicola zhoushanensis]